MNAVRAIDKLKSVWSGNEEAPHSNAPTTRQTTVGSAVGERRSTPRPARLDLRITHAEKQRVELLALREGVAINHVFTRMLDLYEREHGRVELISHVADSQELDR